MRDNLLAAADNLKVLEGIMGRMGSESKDSLGASEAFAYVMTRCKKDAGELMPQIRWFLEPFGYAEVSRAANPDRHRRKGPDLLKILKNQGFAAIKGVGGFVNLAVENYEWIHRTAVYAPPVKGAGDDKYELAARMLNFPNGGKFSPEWWVPREVALYASFDLKIQTAFEASKTLVDEYVGDPVFEDVLSGILEDPNGPQIDIRKDLVGLLKTRVAVLSDYKLPITPKSERIMVAIETSDEARLKATIEKSMKADPDARRREVNGHVIWEVVEKEADIPMVTIENNAAGPNAAEEEEEDHKLMPNSAVCVAHGHLFWSTHIDFMIKVLDSAPDREKLIESADYLQVESELAKIVGSENCALAFSRTDEEYRAVYELIRAGKMPEAETMFGRLLNSVLGDGNKKGVPRRRASTAASCPISKRCGATSVRPV